MKNSEYLIDTHVWLWWLFEPERLTSRVLEIMADSQSQLTLSVASIWEMAIKEASGKLRLPSKAQEFVPRTLARYRFSTLEIQTLHALEAAALPVHHADPFDRVLVAQAQLEKIPFLSADKKLDAYGIDRIWN